MNDVTTENKGKLLSGVAIVLAIVSIAISLLALKSRRVESGPVAIPTAESKGMALTNLRKEHVLRVGWGGFPPYTKVNVNETDPNKRAEGFMIDVLNEIAKRGEPPFRIEWHLFQWDVFRSELASGKFDVICDPVYLTVGRAEEFAPSEPISYFGLAAGLVRADDTRFKEFSDIDKPGVVVSLAAGYTSTEYAIQHLKNATLKQFPVGQDAFSHLDEVLNGRADIGLNDVPTVLQYANAHKGKVKALWLDNPPAIVGGGFLARKEDRDLIEFLNDSIKILRADGTLKKLDEKWKTFGMFPEERLVPAAGLK